ncbi:MAG: flavin reductase family protein [Pseudomonadota bacterium]
MTSAAFDSPAFRHAMSQFATGVTVVSGLDADRPLGFVAQSFVSVSLDPPLVAVCPGLQSRSWPLIRTAGRYGVSVLAADQREICDRFASARDNKFEGVDWAPGSELGLPLLTSALLHVECDLVAEHQAGDHTIAVGAVRHLAVPRPEAEPLLFFRGVLERHGAIAAPPDAPDNREPGPSAQPVDGDERAMNVPSGW